MTLSYNAKNILCLKKANKFVFLYFFLKMCECPRLLADEARYPSGFTLMESCRPQLMGYQNSMVAPVSAGYCSVYDPLFNVMSQPMIMPVMPTLPVLPVLPVGIDTAGSMGSPAPIAPVAPVAPVVVATTAAPSTVQAILEEKGVTPVTPVTVVEGPVAAPVVINSVPDSVIKDLAPNAQTLVVATGDVAQPVVITSVPDNAVKAAIAQYNYNPYMGAQTSMTTSDFVDRAAETTKKGFDTLKSIFGIQASAVTGAAATLAVPVIGNITIPTTRQEWMDAIGIKTVSTQSAQGAQVSEQKPWYKKPGYVILWILFALLAIAGGFAIYTRYRTGRKIESLKTLLADMLETVRGFKPEKSVKSVPVVTKEAAAAAYAHKRGATAHKNQFYY